MTEKSKSFLLFYLSPMVRDRAYLKTAMENFKIGKWNQLKFLLEFLPVLFYMKDKAKHSAFASTCKSLRSRELILDYLKHVKNLHLPSWNSSVKEDKGGEYQVLGVVEFFESKDYSKHRTTIIENCNKLMIDLIQFIRANPVISDTCLSE